MHITRGHQQFVNAIPIEIGFADNTVVKIHVHIGNEFLAAKIAFVEITRVICVRGRYVTRKLRRQSLVASRCKTPGIYNRRDILQPELRAALNGSLLLPVSRSVALSFMVK